jgi:beta-N-acetylhexosaminidase
VLPVIYGCEGPTLSLQEKEFFKKTQPLGFIIFERNCQNPEQLKKLISDLKSTLNHKNIPILIDQEGGRVVRLKPPFWQARPAAKSFKNAINVFENAKAIAEELLEVGINVNCAPCADLLIEGADGIIGDRAFSNDPEIVSEFATAMLQGLEAGGVTAVIKHLPGHGRAPVDSHEELPVVATSLTDLRNSDFVPFKELAKASSKAWGMTAHVIYSDIDKNNVATHSQKIIDEIIRSEIGFKGFLVSDCLTMKALSGSFADKAKLAIQAGCDAVLMCQGTLEAYAEVASGLA